ncbi:hypothetical protein J2S43_002126 [Catenuloplanes nepalensis]|uniref:Uncharacterized protein n=1 Tax=Catenuloplanes nepalensis TaxID=587533 RepID=A0ABT9MQA9_9ACTN|nr:hypothetical protein [Catenuloplanes nepalensis]MDP9793614.1 hypothetical protein [Catenuloplanes nepalensis]
MASFSPMRAFIAARLGWGALAACAVLGLLTAAIGGQDAPIPTALENGTAVVPMWRLFAMGAGVVPVLGLYSRLHDLELPGDPLRRAQHRYLAAIVVLCAATYLAIAAAGLHPLVLLMIARSLPGWLGLALISGRLFGWRLAWIAPVLASIVLNYWGSGEVPGTYRWWEFTARPHDDPTAAGISLVLGAAGLLGYLITPWHLRRAGRPASTDRPGGSGSREERRQQVRPPA